MAHEKIESTRVREGVCVNAHKMQHINLPIHYTAEI